MNPQSSPLPLVAPPIIAVTFLAVMYLLSQESALPHAEADELATRFAFVKLALPTPEEFTQKLKDSSKVRHVHPSLKHINTWISSLGAAVALADLDGDGLPNDVCYVDPRIDQVIIAPAPSSKQGRYQPFVLTPTPLPFDGSTMAPMGCLVGDFNEDGLPDVLVYYWGRTPVIFLQKKDPGDGRVSLSKDSFIPCELIEGGDRWFTNAVTQADFDGDGHIDLLIANYFPDGARILDANASGSEEMHSSKAKAFNGGHKHFFLWESVKKGVKEGDPSTPIFREVDAGLDDDVNGGWTLAVGCADLDGDLLPEIYFANDFGPDRLLHNLSTPRNLRFAVLEGRRMLGTPHSCVLGHDSFKGMGIDFADLNGDGVPDIYVSNITSKFALQESQFLWLSTGDVKSLMKGGIAPYRQASEELGLSRSGWAWDCRLADFDNDGQVEAIQATGMINGKINRWPELQALATANSALMKYPQIWPTFGEGTDLSGKDVNPFFVRAKDGRFYNIAPKLGMIEPMVSRGIAIADVNGDGLLDFAVANQWNDSFLFLNNCKAPGDYLGLRVRFPLEPGASETRVDPDPTPKGRPAIGAVARVYLPDGRMLASQVDGGTGHSGKRSPDLHFGLGKLNSAEKLRVELRWRDPEGQVREETLRLPQGWHTIQLGWFKGK